MIRVLGLTLFACALLALTASPGYDRTAVADIGAIELVLQLPETSDPPEYAPDRITRLTIDGKTAVDLDGKVIVADSKLPTEQKVKVKPAAVPDFADEGQGVGCGEDADLGDVDRAGACDAMGQGRDRARIVAAHDAVDAVDPDRERRRRHDRRLRVGQRRERIARIIGPERIALVEFRLFASELQPARRGYDPATLDLVADVLQDVLDDVLDDFLLDHSRFGRGHESGGKGQRSDCGRKTRFSEYRMRQDDPRKVVKNWCLKVVQMLLAN